jgi:Pvc16 N-terminal domain
MSNALAIAAVTRTLRKLLEDAVKQENLSTLPIDIRLTNQFEVTTAPLDKARDSNSTKNQLNLFLYQGLTNASWRNQDLVQQIKPGETGFPPLPLNLHYLVTAYGEGNNDQISQILLGIAALALHDQTTLSRAGIESALAASQLQHQVERVRITPHSLSSEEMSKLWMIFQTPYRLSLAYEVSVVLIESNRPTRAPSPVLTRGENDAGIPAQASLIPTYPTLTEINFTAVENFKKTLSPDRAASIKQPSAKMGEQIALTGSNLAAGSNVKVIFAHPFLKQPNVIAETEFDDRTATTITLTLPNPAPDWLAGLYIVTVEMTVEAGTPREHVITTNGLALPIAPTLVLPIVAARVPNSDNVILTVTCQPPVSTQQQVTLLLTVLKEENLVDGGTPAEDVSLKQISDRQLTPAPPPPLPPNTPPSPPTTTLKFELSEETLTRLGIPANPPIDQRIKAGRYQIRPRLRVDGVDSAIVNYLAIPPVFIGEQNLDIPL